MKVKHIYIGITLLAATLTACQREEIPSYGEGPCTIRIAPRLAQLTRAYVDLPDDMHSFEAGIIVTNLDEVTKKAKMTYTAGGDPQLLMKIEKGRYHVFGYMPYSAAAVYEVADDKSSATITVPNIAGLSSTMATMVSHTMLDIEDADAGTEKTLELNMDHLTAKVTPCFYLAEEYAKLRTIQIKKVEFILDETQQHSVTITYDNAQQSNNAAWQEPEPTAPATKVVAVAYKDVLPANDTLSTKKKAQSYGACYVCPTQSVDGMKIRVTYDVYAKKGEGETYNNKYEPTRRDVVVTNTIKKLGSDTGGKLTAGKEYRLNIKVLPTYLYSLSDHDEDFLLLAD